MITIVKHGLDSKTRLAVCRYLGVAGATKLGTAYEVNGDIPPRLVAAVTRPIQLQQQQMQLQQQPMKPGLPGDPALKTIRTQELVRGYNIGNSEMLDDISFMFQFFQKNASRLAITPDEKIKLKSILERVKQKRA